MSKQRGARLGKTQTVTKSKLAKQLDAMWNDAYVRLPGRTAGHLTEREAAERQVGYYAALETEGELVKHGVFETKIEDADGVRVALRKVAPIEVNAAGGRLQPPPGALREPSDFMVVVPGRKR